MSKAKYSQSSSAKAPAKNAGFGAKSSKNGQQAANKKSSGVKSRNPYLIGGFALLAIIVAVVALSLLNVF